MMDNKKRCPECNGIIYNNCCIHCGLMTNGYYVKNDSAIEKTEMELYNKSYVSMHRNEVGPMQFIFGSLNFSYRNHVVFGFIISVLDLIVSLMIYFILVNNFTGELQHILAIILFIIYLLVNKIFYYIICNPLCLFLDKININLNKKIIKDYKDKLSSHHDKNALAFIINVIIYIIIIYVYNYLIESDLILKFIE